MNYLFIQPVMKKRSIKIINFILLLLFITSLHPSTSADEVEDSLQAIKSIYENQQFTGTIAIEWNNFPVEVDRIKIIFLYDTNELYNESNDVINGKWKFQTDISIWAEGDYDVKLLAHDSNNMVIGQTKFSVQVKSPVGPGKSPRSVFNQNFISQYSGKSFEDILEIKTVVPDGVYSIQIEILKDNVTIFNSNSTVSSNNWSFKTSVASWQAGSYEIRLKAYDQNGEILDLAAFNINIIDNNKEKEDEKEKGFLPGFEALIFLLGIILIVIFSQNNRFK